MTQNIFPQKIHLSQFNILETYFYMFLYENNFQAKKRFPHAIDVVKTKN